MDLLLAAATTDSPVGTKIVCSSTPSTMTVPFRTSNSSSEYQNDLIGGNLDGMTDNLCIPQIFSNTDSGISNSNSSSIRSSNSRSSSGSSSNSNSSNSSRLASMSSSFRILPKPKINQRTHLSLPMHQAQSLHHSDDGEDQHSGNSSSSSENFNARLPSDRFDKLKTAHNECEKRRRDKIQDGFGELRAIVQSSMSLGKRSKASVLRDAVHLIRQLQQQLCQSHKDMPLAAKSICGKEHQQQLQQLQQQEQQQQQLPLLQQVHHQQQHQHQYQQQYPQQQQQQDPHQQQHHQPSVMYAQNSQSANLPSPAEVEVVELKKKLAFATAYIESLNKQKTALVEQVEILRSMEVKMGLHGSNVDRLAFIPSPSASEGSMSPHAL